MSKKVSVLMGIYNCADTLEQAVASIQNQTYGNWELILCDDGSKDDTYAVAKRLADEDARIVLVKNDTNLGLNKTLNKCLHLASGEYIARMDGDDVCDPSRFEKQVYYLDNNPNIGIVSTPMVYFDETGPWGRSYAIDYPKPEDVVSGSPICHAPVMLRKACLDAVGGYSEDDRTMRVEDVDLWIRLYAEGYRCHNLSEPLYWMRNDQNAYARRKYRYRINSTRVRLIGCKKLRLGPKCYIKAFYPMLVGLIPTSVRRRITKWIRK